MLPNPPVGLHKVMIDSAEHGPWAFASLVILYSEIWTVGVTVLD